MTTPSSFSLPAYLERVTASIPDYSVRAGVASCTDAPAPTLNSVSLLMEAQSRAISFENIDVVLGKTISMAPNDVFTKLVCNKRGGYCFEQNTLLQSALSAIGCSVTPMLCRVRWGKKPDENTPFTHIVLSVSGSDFEDHLVDVGFAGNNSINPIALGKNGQPQNMADGTYRTTSEGGYTLLAIQDRSDTSAWMDIYKWRTDRWETTPDFIQSNWFSCTFPGARFTGQFFVARVHASERMHILNGQFVSRSSATGEVLEKEEVESLDKLIGMLNTKFGLTVESSKELGRYI